MPKSLEDTLHDLAKKGELTYFSIVPSPGGFEATYSPASKFGHSWAEDVDPVKAGLAAIGEMQRPRKSAKLEDDPEVTEMLS